MDSNLLYFSNIEIGSRHAFRTSTNSPIIIGNYSARVSNNNHISKVQLSLDEILNFPSLLAEDFINEQPRQTGKILVFFYAEWCPFSRIAAHNLALLNPISYKIFRVDLSDENNTLWASFKIKRIPTLIAFYDGKELWRREAIYMMGLRNNDFSESDSMIKTKVTE